MANQQVDFVYDRKNPFILVNESEGNELYVDYKSKIVKIIWNGIVDVEPASKLLTIGANLIESRECNKILLCRQELNEFTIQARLWIKQELLMKRAKKLAGDVEKIAAVNARTIKGSVFANFISSAIKLILPSLVLKKFHDEGEALTWLAE
ncbi:MAG: hypothetical protein AAGA66_12485 [Bacteroidota bacterium]